MNKTLGKIRGLWKREKNIKRERGAYGGSR